MEEIITPESILTSIKKMLGISSEESGSDEHFDADIIADINTAFLSLNQLAVGPIIGFSIDDATATWIDYLGEGVKPGAIKTFIYLKVRLLFDPPSNAFTIEAMERQIKELEWRLNVKAEEVIQNGDEVVG